MKNYINIKSLLIASFLLMGVNLFAQEDTESSDLSPALGNGLQFNFNKGDYQFKIGGLIQPEIGFRRDSTAETKYFLNSKRSYLNISGKAKKENISFLVQIDFSLANPLLDAWVAYKPSKYLSVTFGQHLAIANNREMTFMETHLQFLERSLVSTQYSASGREFGLVAASELSLGGILVNPKVSVSSGDGRNSFGTSGTDYDLGGVKYAARLDVLPFGSFTKGNELLVADLATESKPKLVLGLAFSNNRGVTHVTGEGHGNFLMYNNTGKNQLPNYRKLYYDLLFKYKGFSFLAEYVVATAKVSNGTYLDATGLNVLEPTEISELLALGNGLNMHLCYVFNKKHGIDVRYANVEGEFANNAKSIIGAQKEFSYGITRYAQGNNLKVSWYITHLNLGSTTSMLGNINVQLVF
jgi:hypothetical protein